MAPVPVLAQCLAPGSVRYDPTNQPNNKKNKVSIQRLVREVNPLSYALLRHCLVNHIDYLLMIHFNQNIRCFQLFWLAC